MQPTVPKITVTPSDAHYPSKCCFYKSKKKKLEQIKEIAQNSIPTPLPQIHTSEVSSDIAVRSSYEGHQSH